MFTANEMREITEQARYEKKLHDKCVAQHFFSDNFDLIREAAKDGEDSAELSVVGTDRDSVKEIIRLYRRFGYSVNIIHQNFFTIFLEIHW